MSFKPRHYVKKVAEKEPPKRGKSSFKGIGTTFSFTALFAGAYILISQIIIPVAYYRADSPLITPIVGAFASANQSNLTIQLERIEDPPPPFFYLSIPKLELEEVAVETNSTNSPNQWLVHLYGSGLPDNQSPDQPPIIISGHSVSSWFFNHDDPKTYFAKLTQLKPGDEIMINYREKQHKYTVRESEITKPKELWDAIYNGVAKNQAELVLFTCVPPGLPINRLLVFADETTNEEVYSQTEKETGEDLKVLEPDQPESQP